MNFILAIIIEGYMEVRNHNKESLVEMNFFLDIATINQETPSLYMP